MLISKFSLSLCHLVSIPSYLTIDFTPEIISFLYNILNLPLSIGLFPSTHNHVLGKFTSNRNLPCPYVLHLQWPFSSFLQQNLQAFILDKLLIKISNDFHQSDPCYTEGAKKHTHILRKKTKLY